MPRGIQLKEKDRAEPQKSLSHIVLADRMRPLQIFDSARCTSELYAQVIAKRVSVFSELPINLIGSGVLRTEDPRHINLRPWLVVSSASQGDWRNQNGPFRQLPIRRLKRVTAVVPPEILAGRATHTGQIGMRFKASSTRPIKPRNANSLNLSNHQ